MRTYAPKTAYRHMLRECVEDLVYWLNYATRPEAHIQKWAMMKAKTTRALIREIKQEIKEINRHA